MTKIIKFTTLETRTLEIPEKIWMDVWRQTGSATRAAVHLNKLGYDEKIGRPVTSAIVLKNAWTWALYTPDEAREMLDNERLRAGMSAYDDREFDVMIIKRAMSMLNTKLRHFSHWIELNDYQKYYYVYERRFPRIARKHKKQFEKSNSQEVQV